VQAVHLTLFFVAIVHAVTVVLLVLLSVRISKHWEGIESRDFLHWRDAKERKIELSAQLSRTPWWLKALCCTIRESLEYNRLLELVRFHELKWRFLRSNHLPPHFHFTSYLRKAKQHVFRDLGILPSGLWAVLAAVLLVDLLLRSSSTEYALAISLNLAVPVVAFLVVLGCSVVLVKIRFVYWSIMHSDVVEIAPSVALNATSWMMVERRLDGWTSSFHMSSSHLPVSPSALSSVPEEDSDVVAPKPSVSKDSEAHIRLPDRKLHMSMPAIPQAAVKSARHLSSSIIEKPQLRQRSSSRFLHDGLIAGNIRLPHQPSETSIQSGSDGKASESIRPIRRMTWVADQTEMGPAAASPLSQQHTISEHTPDARCNWCVCGQAHAPGEEFHQRDLFWFRNPPFLLHIMRGLLFVASVLIAVLIQFGPAWASDTSTRSVTIAIITVSVIAMLVGILVLLERVVPVYVFSTHVGELVDEKLLLQALRKSDRRHAIRIAKLVARAERRRRRQKRQHRELGSSVDASGPDPGSTTPVAALGPDPGSTTPVDPGTPPVDAASKIPLHKAVARLRDPLPRRRDSKPVEPTAGVRAERASSLAVFAAEQEGDSARADGASASGAPLAISGAFWGEGGDWKPAQARQVLWGVGETASDAPIAASALTTDEWAALMAGLPEDQCLKLPRQARKALIEAFASDLSSSSSSNDDDDDEDDATPTKKQLRQQKKRRRAERSVRCSSAVGEWCTRSVLPRVFGDDAYETDSDEEDKEALPDTKSFRPRGCVGCLARTGDLLARSQRWSALMFLVVAADTVSAVLQTQSQVIEDIGTGAVSVGSTITAVSGCIFAFELLLRTVGSLAYVCTGRGAVVFAPTPADIAEERATLSQWADDSPESSLWTPWATTLRVLWRTADLLVLAGCTVVSMAVGFGGGTTSSFWTALVAIRILFLAPWRRALLGDPAMTDGHDHSEELAMRRRLHAKYYHAHGEHHHRHRHHHHHHHHRGSVVAGGGSGGVGGGESDSGFAGSSLTSVLAARGELTFYSSDRDYSHGLTTTQLQVATIASRLAHSGDGIQLHRRDSGSNVTAPPAAGHPPEEASPADVAIAVKSGRRWSSLSNRDSSSRRTSRVDDVTAAEDLSSSSDEEQGESDPVTAALGAELSRVMSHRGSIMVMSPDELAAALEDESVVRAIAPTDSVPAPETPWGEDSDSSLSDD
jgi:hypothetical protein